MVAQLSCLQMCVVGRNTFIGAGNIFTDFHLLQNPLRTFHKWRGAATPSLEDIGLPVIGSAIGHNVRIGSGFVFYPARMIGSHTTLIYSEKQTAIVRNINVRYDQEQEDEHEEQQQTVYLWPNQYDPETHEPANKPVDQFSLSVAPSVHTHY